MKKCLLSMICVMPLLLSGCATFNPFEGISNPPDPPRKIGSWTQEEKVTPRIVVPPGGQPIVISEIERRYDARAEETAPRLTIGQRIGRFFASLSIWGILFIVVSLVFFGGAPIVWVAKKYFRAKQALSSTVAAIRDVDEETFKKLKPSLEAKQDRSDKEYIAKIKAKL